MTTSYDVLLPTEDIHLRDLDDPDMVTSEVIDDILERELGRGYRTKHPQNSYRSVYYRCSIVFQSVSIICCHCSSFFKLIVCNCKNGLGDDLQLILVFGI